MNEKQVELLKKAIFLCGQMEQSGTLGYLTEILKIEQENDDEDSPMNPDVAGKD